MFVTHQGTLLAAPDMELLLALRDGKLVGTLTMQGVSRGAGFFLPHLVELTKRRSQSLSRRPAVMIGSGSSALLVDSPQKEHDLVPTGER